MNHARFKEFLQNSDLSTRNFALLVGTAFVSKTSAARFTQSDGGGLSRAYMKKVMPMMIETCARFMRGIGKNEEEINTVLLEIFEKEYQPVITKRTKLDDEVLEFFGFDRDPFALESDPRSADEAFTTKELERISRRVEDAVTYQGFLAILGNIGAGKSALKNRVADKLKKQGRTHLIFPKFAEMQKVNAGAIVHYLLEYFGQKPRHRLVMAQRQLETHLEYLCGQGIRIALCFDECHRLHDTTVTALKNFYELGTGGYERYLGLILFGQPAFKTRLDDAQFREIAERLEIVEMPSLSKYAAEYINHRLQLVGASNQIFENRAIEEIAKQAGTPLAIGNLANKALIAAYKKAEPKVLARFITADNEPLARKTASSR